MPQIRHLSFANHTIFLKLAIGLFPPSSFQIPLSGTHWKYPTSILLARESVEIVLVLTARGTAGNTADL